jgi:hypothetical protein
MAADLTTLPAHIQAAIDADPHRPGSVDRVLLDRQRWLTAATRDHLYAAPEPATAATAVARPALDAVVAECTHDSVHPFQRMTALRRRVAALRPRPLPDGALLCGGTEEELLARGTPFAAELSRLLVVLAGRAGIPARLVFLYAAEPPVRHTVVEAYIMRRWSVFDPLSDRAFAWPKHGYASAWDINRMPALLDGLQDHGRLPYVASRYYRSIAIADYDPSTADLGFALDPVDEATAARLRRGEAA